VSEPRHFTLSRYSEGVKHSRTQETSITHYTQHGVIQAWTMDMESNQNVESKQKSVKSKMGKRGVQLLAHLQFYK